MDVRVNGRPMGSVVESTQPPVVSATVRGTDTIERVEVVKFFQGSPEPFPVVYSVSPPGGDASFEWRDLDFKSDSAYYVRVTQRADPRIVNKKNFGSATSFPNEMAWSSPIWVTKPPR
jgi:hypothetical protein